MKRILSPVLPVVLFFLSSGFLPHGDAMVQSFNKTVFYQVIKDGNKEEINGQLTLLNIAHGIEKQAFEGALLMKKAGQLRTPPEKLQAFKQGRIKLEDAIKKEGQNAEFRFLRLIIQENAPKILKYHSDKDADAALIQVHFKHLPLEVQQAILDYRLRSNALKPLNF